LPFSRIEGGAARPSVLVTARAVVVALVLAATVAALTSGPVRLIAPPHGPNHPGKSEATHLGISMLLCVLHRGKDSCEFDANETQVACLAAGEY